MARRHLFESVAQCHLTAFLLHLERGASGSRPLRIDDAMNLFAGEEGAAVGNHSRDLAFHRACEYIETNLSEPLSPALIAKHAYISLSQLTRLFHSEAQMPVMQWVWQRRIEMAQKLLRQTTLPVGEISRLVGFQHQSHFSQVFTRNVGVSPLAFRKDAGAKIPR
jgi:AraC-like DNA-binding protein